MSGGARSGSERGDGAPDAMGRRPRGTWFGAAVLAALVMVLSGAVILTGRVGTGESADQVNYHLPVIRTFANAWPAPNLRSYDSATTPGYHLMMALVWSASGASERWAENPKAPIGAGPSEAYPAVTLSGPEREAWGAFVRDLRPMQAVNVLLSVGLVLTVYLTAARFVAWWASLALTLPLALNQYVLGASIWLTTDNAGWWCALAALAAAMTARGAGGLLKAGAWASIGVLVRQVHLWVGGPIAAAGLLAWLMGRREERGRSLASTLVACAVPALIVAGFVWVWGGLTPPSDRIRAVHGKGINLAAAPFALAVFGAYAVFAWSAWRDEAVRVTKRWGLVVSVAIGAAALALLIPTSTQAPTLTDPPQRGYGWLWKLSGALPAPDERAVVLTLGAGFGAAVLVLMFNAARRRGNGCGALILLVGLACWLLAQAMNPVAWQRYFDPLVLTAVAWLAALGVPDSRRRGLALGAVMLAVMMAGLSYRSIWKDLARDELPFDGGVLKMQGRLEPVTAPARHL